MSCVFTSRSFYLLLIQQLIGNSTPDPIDEGSNGIADARSFWPAARHCCMIWPQYGNVRMQTLPTSVTSASSPPKCSK